MVDEISIRECITIAEFDSCIRLQRDVFGLPDLEISPRRHLIVSRQAGGWTLGAFMREHLVGFVHHMVAVRGNDEVFGYSHMMAVSADYQNRGIGARLKWAQRERALGEGRSFIKWTWEPMRARNAHFNLNRLGVIVEGYAENFYGTDYVTDPQLKAEAPGIDSDRLFASWYIRSERVAELAEGREPEAPASPVMSIEIPANWFAIMKEDPRTAKREQLRVREEFKRAHSEGLVCAGFERDPSRPKYLFYERGRL